LQKHVFPGVPGLLICNDARLDLERALFDPFILADPFRYDKDEFLTGFVAAIERRVGDLSRFRLTGLSEENLSGDVLNGKEARALADRLFETFGPTRILIVVRNQLDMLLSIYSNYIVHGGICALAELASDLNLEGMRVFHKLQYSGLVEHYRRLHGAEKVHVVFFETLTRERQPLRQFFHGLGVSEDLPETATLRENQGRSLVANGVMRQFNRFGVNGRHVAHLVAWDRREADRRKVRELFPDAVAEWREDNRRLADVLAIDLPLAYAL
jgi:hypothetical protein